MLQSKYHAFCSKKLRCCKNRVFKQEQGFLIFSCCARRNQCVWMRLAILLAHVQSEGDREQQWVWKLSFLSIIFNWFNSRTQHSSHESITPCQIIYHVMSRCACIFMHGYLLQIVPGPYLEPLKSVRGEWLVTKNALASFRSAWNQKQMPIPCFQNLSYYALQSCCLELSTSF